MKWVAAAWPFLLRFLFFQPSCLGLCLSWNADVFLCLFPSFPSLFIIIFLYQSYFWAVFVWQKHVCLMHWKLVLEQLLPKLLYRTRKSDVFFPTFGLFQVGTWSTQFSVYWHLQLACVNCKMYATLRVKQNSLFQGNSKPFLLPFSFCSVSSLCFVLLVFFNLYSIFYISVAKISLDWYCMKTVLSWGLV